MTGPQPEFLLRHAARRSRDATGPCLDDDTIGALAEGALDGAARSVALPHLASCVRCRSAVASVARILADPAVAREIAAPRARVLRFPAIAIAALAAAILLMVSLPRQGPDVGASHRASDITAVVAPMPVSPIGIVPSAERLRWATVAGADRYRAALFDERGTVLYETLTSDTMVVLPDTVRLASGRTFLWKVEARTGWGRWSASELTEFSIR